MISQKLKLLDQELLKINAPVLKHFRKGVSKSYFNEFIKKFFSGIQSPEELFKIYSWHEGVNVYNGISAENFYFLSSFYLNQLDEIALIYEEDVFNFKSNKHFPLCSSGQGEFLSINMLNFSSSIIDTPIFLNQLYDPSKESYVTIYDNIYKMFDTVIECYKQKIYYIESGVININIDQEWELSKKMNPISDFWK